ncbi:hypothetical protein HZS_3866 [Henneguya salminicola]|nr:hypothetical protein HZS_3866 [Henneguya salminicola]
MGRKGEMDVVKIRAKDLVKTRRFIKKFIIMKANIEAAALKVQTLKSSNDMAVAMKGVGIALGSMNKRMNLPEIQKIMHNFEKESEIMDTKQELMEDAIDDVTGEAEDDEESEALTAKVLADLGIAISQEVGGLPATGAAINNKEAERDIGDLESRLEKLRKN